MRRLVRSRRCFHSSPFSRNAIDRSNQTDEIEYHPKRNPVGVQLLSRKLHDQLFRNVTFSAPDSSYINIAREHLQMHELDPTQASVLPNTAFTLPQLQGRTLEEHFHRIGTRAAHPWRALATTLATSTLPPMPDHWDTRQSGWTKYYYRPDGSSFSEHVPYPAEDEQTLVFDVETMPKYHPYAILACAASPTAWYAWISPWLLGESDDPEHLISINGGRMARDIPRLVVGHNVSYDRVRIRDEYSLSQTRTRFLDTMALHVSVSGISSHQRPAWLHHRKTQEERRKETVEAVVEYMREGDMQEACEEDVRRREEWRRIRRDMEESLPLLEAYDEGATGEGEAAARRWEDITSANSLADVARLHCGIHVNKKVRDDFMTHTPADIRENLTDYLSYCATDVNVTHAVFAKVLPAFFLACPSAVSFAGVLVMGSSFLPVNEAWEEYLGEAERVYKELEARVKTRLKDLAEEARQAMETGEWRNDVWLSQLDWTPKVAGKSRGVVHSDEAALRVESPDSTTALPPAQSPAFLLPAWYAGVLSDPLSKTVIQHTLPFLLGLSFDGYPLIYSPAEKWHFRAPSSNTDVSTIIARPPSARKSKIERVLGPKHGVTYLRNGRMHANNKDLALAACALSGFGSSSDKRNGREGGEKLAKRILKLAKHTYKCTDRSTVNTDPWLSQLDWTMVDPSFAPLKTKPATKSKAKVKHPPVLWPKWYWDQAKPRKDVLPGTLDITVRNRIAPILLRLSWLGWPLFHSKEHGWTFRVPTNHDNGITNGDGDNSHTARHPSVPRYRPLAFNDPADHALRESCLHDGFAFYKLPHKDGDEANVGSPLGKTFIKYAMDGTLESPGDEAREALEMNAMCSYWISARDRITNQLVVWQTGERDLGFPKSVDDGTRKGGETSKGKWGIILPQVITMGTVTRRAIEKTWLTASNAKPNRVGSELKAMVRAPPGYAIVGADVDSEELWISSCMGDAQFGMHGATAIGWMTLEGSKAAGTDLHSKTAAILGISRDQAKVFNYSRIYGAGRRHAVLLLLQSNPSMTQEEAKKLAANLYASTKGRNTHRADMFGRKFWFGGTESFVFNKLEEIAMSERPQTPALGCGVTHALSKESLPSEYGSDYMPSRINWVVQSSGVDYLHLLMVSMEHLIAKYDIDARYLISVHDELRYLVKDADRFRAALALQIANLWTRSLFALKLGMDDLPRGVAFFSAVDVDRVLRKEVDMPCVTPSQRSPIPPGERLDIEEVLEKTNGGSLWADGRPMEEWSAEEEMRLKGEDELEGYSSFDVLAHRAPSAEFLRAQTTTEVGELKYLARRASSKAGGADDSSRKITAKGKTKPRTMVPLGNGDEEMDWSDDVDVFRNSGTV